MRRRAAAARFHADVQAGLPGAPGQLGRKRRLRHRLAARQGHTPTALRIEYAVPQHGFQHLVHGRSTPDHLQRARRTALRAAAAGGAAGPVQPVRVRRKQMRAPGAGGACPAADAFVRVETELRRGRFALRIVAPGAVERTAFQKYRRADARPVLDRKALYIENCTRNQEPSPFRMELSGSYPWPQE